MVAMDHTNTSLCLHCELIVLLCRDGHRLGGALCYCFVGTSWISNPVQTQRCMTGSRSPSGGLLSPYHMFLSSCVLPAILRSFFHAL